MTAAHILVAEDEPDIRANLGRLLRLEGFDVSLAASGAQALQMAHTRRPDLVLTDLMMPGMDGRRLLRALRGDPRTAGVPVVCLSARVEAADMQGAVAAGASAYITKPYQSATLLACIRGLLAPGGVTET
ncbi:response regulator [Pseudorhodoferax sp. Leaf267]|uniref:response regulator n=1 Tax=Pseudorhodoferax sp. Leaf267 TaxID=1736316 RepID=UPI0006FCC286|nr:response regulator [Pseudorhodoferax sp. Leaf267]KQP13542.1 hypothetical protein ASF43_16615 [Pseudorhodoferax sp. Leaf267]